MAAKVEASGRGWHREVAASRATRGDGECSGERGRGRRREHRKPAQAWRERWSRDSSNRPAEGDWEQAAGARQSGGDKLGRLLTGVRWRAGSVSQRPVAERKNHAPPAAATAATHGYPQPNRHRVALGESNDDHRPFTVPINVPTGAGAPSCSKTKGNQLPPLPLAAAGWRPTFPVVTLSASECPAGGSP